MGVDIDEWQQHITIDVAITSTDTKAIMSTGTRATMSIGRIIQRITVGALIMCIGRTIRYITGAKGITSSGIMSTVGMAITFTARRDITFTAAKVFMFIEGVMRCKGIVHIMRVALIRGRHA